MVFPVTFTKEWWLNGRNTTDSKDPDMGVFCEQATCTATCKISQETHSTLYIWLAEVSLRDLVLGSILLKWWLCKLPFSFSSHFQWCQPLNQCPHRSRPVNRQRLTWNNKQEYLLLLLHLRTQPELQSGQSNVPSQEQIFDETQSRWRLNYCNTPTTTPHHHQQQHYHHMMWPCLDCGGPGHSYSALNKIIINNNQILSLILDWDLAQPVKSSLWQGQSYIIPKYEDVCRIHFRWQWSWYPPGFKYKTKILHPSC